MNKHLFFANLRFGTGAHHCNNNDQLYTQQPVATSACQYTLAARRAVAELAGANATAVRRIAQTRSSVGAHHPNVDARHHDHAALLSGVQRQLALGPSAGVEATEAAAAARRAERALLGGRQNDGAAFAQQRAANGQRAHFAVGAHHAGLDARLARGGVGQIGAAAHVGIAAVLTAPLLHAAGAQVARNAKLAVAVFAIATTQHSGARQSARKFREIKQRPYDLGSHELPRVS